MRISSTIIFQKTVRSHSGLEFLRIQFLTGMKIHGPDGVMENCFSGHHNYFLTKRQKTEIGFVRIKRSHQTVVIVGELDK